MQCADTAFSKATRAGEFEDSDIAFSATTDEPTTSANVVNSRLFKHHSARRSVIGRRFISQRFLYSLNKDRTHITAGCFLHFRVRHPRKGGAHVPNQNNSNP